MYGPDGSLGISVVEVTQTGAFVGTGALDGAFFGNDITICISHPFGDMRRKLFGWIPFIDAVSMCLQRDPDDRPTLDELEPW